MITENAVTSEPVPAVVGIAMSGIIFPGTLCAPSYSVMLPPYFAVTPTALATSIGEPPPSATIKSAPASLNAVVAFSTVVTDGFASISVKISTFMPASSRYFAALSTIPILRSVGPDSSMAWVPPSFCAHSGSRTSVPAPTIIFCGIKNSNGFIICLFSHFISVFI